jgi:hypothetical protein
MSIGETICGFTAVFLVGLSVGNYVTAWLDGRVKDKCDVLYKLNRIQDKLDDMSHHVQLELIHQLNLERSGRCADSMTMHRELKRCESELKYVKSILNQLLCGLDK